MLATYDTKPKRKVPGGLMAFLGAVILVVVLVALIFGGFVGFPQGSKDDAAAALEAPTASPSTTSTPTPESCQPQYTQIASNNENSRVIGDFEVRYAAAAAEANNLSDAQKQLLLEESGKDASVLSTWGYAFGLYENTDKWKELTADGCLSSEGIKLHNQLEGALSAKGVKFEEAMAPENGFNSGVHDGVYGVSDAPGVRGDRKAIKVTMKDGTVVYILVRCGNPVYPGKPNLPHVPTDNPPPPEKPKPEKPKPTPPPEKPKPGKDPAKDPYPNGNAPDGGGKNNDPGPGPYVPPQEMERPPETPRENPAPPPPKPPAPKPNNPAPQPVPTKDPAPPPPPETTAPEPTAPETVCDPSAPGATCP